MGFNGGEVAGLTGGALVLLIIFLVTFGLFIVGGIVLLVLVKSSRNQDKFVSEHSVAAKKIRELKEKHKYLSVLNVTLNHSYTDQDTYNNTSCKDYLVSVINDNPKVIKEPFDNATHNKEEYELFSKEIKDSHIKYGEYDVEVSKYNIEKLNEKEKKLIKNLDTPPYMNFKVYVCLNKTNEKGKVLESKKQTFVYSEIEELMK